MSRETPEPRPLGARIGRTLLGTLFLGIGLIGLGRLRQGLFFYVAPFALILVATIPLTLNVALPGGARLRHAQSISRLYPERKHASDAGS